MRYPAALPAIALGLGISAGIWLHVPLHPIFLATIWSAAFAAFLRHRETEATVCLTGGFLACGAFLGARADVLACTAPLRTLFEDHAANSGHQLFGHVTGRLRADAMRGPTGVTLKVEVESVQLERTVYQTSGGALVSISGALGTGQILEWRSGRRVAFPATLRKPASYLNPGLEDSERTSAWRGTSLVGSVKSDRLVEILSPGGWLAETTASIRAGIRKAIGSTVAPWSARSATVVNAILIGDRSGLEDEVERNLQEAGTYHVIAISGGNIAILAGACLLMLRAARVESRLSSLLVILMLGAYATVVEGGSSVGRATLMAAIYFSARVWDHQPRGGNVAALTAAILLCFRPLHIVDAGFALTFGATLGILIGLSRIAWLPALSWWAKTAVALFAASVCAEIALLPIGARVFSRVTFAGLLVNFAAVPLMTVVQMAGMAAAGLAAWAPEPGRWAGWVAHVAVEGLIGSARLIEVLPWLTRRLAPPSAWIVVAYYAALILTLVSRRLILLVAVVGFGLWIVAAPAAPLVSRDRLLRVAFLDVGQGDASVVRFPDGRTLSIDAGGTPGGFDIGSRVVSPAFWALGVRRLDYMSLTHGDEDHIGGAASVFRDFGPFEVWEGVPVPPHEPTRQLRALVHRRGAVWRTLQPDDKVSFGNVDLLVRHPPRPAWERQRVRNNDSEVIEVRHGGVSFVFTGDIGREVEREIAPSFERVPIRILKVPHHGSATSSSPEFLRLLQPDIAVISAGRGNTFGHPAAVVLERYRNLGAAIYRTDRDGAILIETDGFTVRIGTFSGRKLTLRTYGR
jgi:competence protein ComEC